MITKNGIHLLNANQLTNLASKIEKNFPGYWYSISQKKDELYISFGPGRNSLLDIDRAWAHTQEGDAGIQVSYSTVKMEDISTTTIVGGLEEIVKAKRAALFETNPVLPLRNTTYRRQSADDWEKFKKRYNRFLKEELAVLEERVILDQVYIGSCDLSVDVSLRGKDKAGNEVDITVDLLDKSILRDSLDGAIADVLQEESV